MVLIIVGLLVTTVISLISIVTTDGRKLLKSVLAILTLAGFLLAVGSAWQDNSDKAATEKELADAQRRLATLQTMLALVNVTVGDLAKLNELSGGSRYYVRIAADTVRERLDPYLRNIESQFKGAHSSGMVAIREPRPGSHNYELVFGQGLDVAAAEVFHRLAISHHLTPSAGGAAGSEQEIAYIVPEPAGK
jgi:hypothetical protein